MDPLAMHNQLLTMQLVSKPVMLWRVLGLRDTNFYQPCYLRIKQGYILTIDLYLISYECKHSVFLHAHSLSELAPSFDTLLVPLLVN